MMALPGAYLDRGTSQFCVRSLIGRSSSANRWSSSLSALRSDGGCEPDCPEATAACDDTIEASMDSAADDAADAIADDVDGRPGGGGMRCPEVLWELIARAACLSGTNNP